jgi:chemotaxis protein methyltransferase CheR
MKDTECVEFLQWVLPRLRMRWPGFRKVRRQVCRRIERRLHELGLPGVDAYRAYLQTNPEEWERLDELCHVTISRFCRDRGVFEFLQRAVLPELARHAARRGAALEAWSAGCASGEEPYTLALVWHLELGAAFPAVALHVLATDVDETMLRRARAAEYPESSLRELPQAWRCTGFVQRDGRYRLRDELRSSLTVRRHDLRQTPPGRPLRSRPLPERRLHLLRPRPPTGGRRPARGVHQTGWSTRPRRARNAARRSMRVHAMVGPHLPTGALLK